MLPPTVMIRLPSAAPMRVPAAPSVDNSTADVTAPSAEPEAPSQLICRPLDSLITPHYPHQSLEGQIRSRTGDKRRDEYRDSYFLIRLHVIHPVPRKTII